MSASKNTIALGILTLVAGCLLTAAGTMWSAEPVASTPLPAASTEAVPEQPADKKANGDVGYISSIRFSHDGKQYAVVSGGEITFLDMASQPGMKCAAVRNENVTLYDTATRKPIWSIPGEATGFLPEGKSIIVMGPKSVTLHDKETGKATKEYPRPKNKLDWAKFAFSADGKRYAVRVNHNVQMYDTATGFEPIRLEEPDRINHVILGKMPFGLRQGEDLSFSPNGKELIAEGVATSHASSAVVRWNVETGEQIDEFFTLKEYGNEWPQSAAFAPDGKLLAIAYKDRVELRTGPKDIVKKLPVAGKATKIAFSPDGKLLAVGIRGEINNTLHNEPRASAKPLDKIIKRLSEAVVEINLGTDDQVHLGQKFITLPGDYPEKGSKSRMREFRVPDEKGEYKKVERFVAKGLLEVVEVLGPKLSRCRITSENEPIRDAVGAGDLLYNVGNRSEVQVLDVATGKELWRFDGFEGNAASTELGVTALTFSPDGKTLLAGTGILPGERYPETVRKTKSGEVKSWKLEDKPKPPPQWRELGKLDGIDDYVDSIAFSPDGKSFVVGGLGGEAKQTLSMWDADTHKKQWAGGPAPPAIADVSFSPDGKLVAVTGDKTIDFYDARTGKLVELKKPFPGSKVVAFSPDGKWVGHSNSHTIGFRALDENRGEAHITLDKQFEALSEKLQAAVAWSPDSLYMAYAMPTTPEEDWLVGMMGVTPETKPKNLAGHKGKVTAVAWSRDGKYLASGGELGKVIIWNAKTFEEIKRVNYGGGDGWSKINALAFSHDSRTLAIALELAEAKNAQRVVLMDPATGERTQNDLQFFWNAPPVTVAFSPDGKTMLVGCGYRDIVRRKLPPEERKKLGEVRIFTTEPEKPVAKPGAGDSPEAMAAPKWREKAVLKTSNDSSTTSGALRALSGDSIGDFLAVSVAFDPKGQTFAVGGDDSLMRVWNAKDYKRIPFENPFWMFTQLQSRSVVGIGVPNSRSDLNPNALDDLTRPVYRMNSLPSQIKYDKSSRPKPFPIAVAYSSDGLLLANTGPGGAQVMEWATKKPAFTKRIPSTGNLPEATLPQLLESNIVPRAIAFAPTEEINGKKRYALALTDGQSICVKTWIDGGPPSTAKLGPIAEAPKFEGLPPAAESPKFEGFSPVGVAYSPDGKQLVFIPNYKMAPDGPDGKPDPKKEATHWIAQIWGGGSGAPMAFLKHGTAQVIAVAWSADGKFIATGDARGDVVLWDGKTFKEVRRTKIGGRGGNSYIHSLAFSASGKTLAVGVTLDEGRNINRVVFFDPASGNRGDDLREFASEPLSLAFSPDDKMLIVGCGYRDAETRKMTAEERKRAGEVRVFTTEP
jgi:WD40 repeat protein